MRCSAGGDRVSVQADDMHAYLSAILLAQFANRASLAAALAVGLLVVMAMVIGDVLDREQRRHHQE